MGHEARQNPFSLDGAAPSTPEVRDARGRLLQADDEIILAVPGPVYFRVAGVTPVLDPKAPPGLLNVHMGCMMTFTVKSGSAAHREFVRVRTAEEAGPSEFQLLDAQPKPTEASGPQGIVRGPDPRD